MKKFIKATEAYYLKMAQYYGWDRESARDLVYDAYAAIVAKRLEPTFTLGKTMIKNAHANIVRNKNVGISDTWLTNENYLPLVEHGRKRVLLAEVCPVELPRVSSLDFEEVISYMENTLPPDDYALIMMRAHGYPYEKLQKKFQLSRGQVLYRMRLIRNHLKARFPYVLDEL